MEKEFYFTKHALAEMNNDDISMEDVKDIAINGEIIKIYPEDKKGLSQLMLGWTGMSKDKPFHVVCAHRTSAIHIITAYKPDPALWSDDFKTRKFKK